MNSTVHIRLIIFISLLCIFTSVVSACSANRQTNTSIFEENSISSLTVDNTESISIHEDFSFPQCYSRQIKSVSFNIDNIICPESVSLHEGEATKVEFDKTGLAEFLLKDVKYRYDKALGGFFETTFPEDPSAINHCYVSDRFSYFSSESCRMDEIYYYPVIDFVGPHESDSWLNNYCSKSVFSFGTEEKCINDIKDTFRRYGLDLELYDFDVTTYYLDHSRIKSSGTNLSSEDDFYIFCFNQKCQGLRDFHHFYNDYWNGILSPEECTMEVVYGTKGIVRIMTNRAIYQYDMSEEYFKLKSFDDIADIVSEWCNNSINNGLKYDISRAELYFGFDNKTSKTVLKPIWNFLVRIQNNNGSYSEIDLNFDAVNGKYVSIA